MFIIIKFKLRSSHKRPYLLILRRIFIFCLYQLQTIKFIYLSNQKQLIINLVSNPNLYFLYQKVIIQSINSSTNQLIELQKSLNSKIFLGLKNVQFKIYGSYNFFRKFIKIFYSDIYILIDLKYKKCKGFSMVFCESFIITFVCKILTIRMVNQILFIIRYQPNFTLSPQILNNRLSLQNSIQFNKFKIDYRQIINNCQVSLSKTQQNIKIFDKINIIINIYINQYSQQTINQNKFSILALIDKNVLQQLAKL
ncbi:hypothetical protein TTHERM_000551068 (macronuclear) [Tetrahymena thermophila SB210]|uniref:Uncharacterized protein n=1 Tax=Tetrahymena thermophila (strain SB210) TaxID=312017 RepID=W7X9J2_TETTS|nr:hypothetical protein TTHERM_000551068 [Tetrahymena thermophila SB210]EWS76080.1 hypothetical protein TTHERM_000551068 [Tetrahymena thermophila SB210]|eukprot:XP_012651387.1 hypothetical protein TTHERM_000551068 [Tetrahymena thermophila SB210]